MEAVLCRASTEEHKENQPPMSLTIIYLFCLVQVLLHRRKKRKEDDWKEEKE